GGPDVWGGAPVGGAPSGDAPQPEAVVQPPRPCLEVVDRHQDVVDDRRRVKPFRRLAEGRHSVPLPAPTCAPPRPACAARGSPRLARAPASRPADRSARPPP